MDAAYALQVVEVIATLVNPLTPNPNLTLTSRTATPTLSPTLILYPSLTLNSEPVTNQGQQHPPSPTLILYPSLTLSSEPITNLNPNPSGSTPTLTPTLTLTLQAQCQAMEMPALPLSPFNLSDFSWSPRKRCTRCLRRTARGDKELLLLKFLHSSSPDEVWCLPPADWNRLCRAMRGNTVGESARNRPAQPPQSRPQPAPQSPRPCSGCVGGTLTPKQIKRVYSKEDSNVLLGEVCLVCKNGLRNDTNGTKLDLLRQKIMIQRAANDALKTSGAPNQSHETVSNPSAASRPAESPPPQSSRPCSGCVDGTLKSKQIKRVYSEVLPGESRVLLGEVCLTCKNGLRKDTNGTKAEKLDLLRQKIVKRAHEAQAPANADDALNASGAPNDAGDALNAGGALDAGNAGEEEVNQKLTSRTAPHTSQPRITLHHSHHVTAPQLHRNYTAPTLRRRTGHGWSQSAWPCQTWRAWPCRTWRAWPSITVKITLSGRRIQRVCIGTGPAAPGPKTRTAYGARQMS